MPREQGAPSCGSTATRTCVAYTSGSDSPTSTLSIPAGINLHRRTPRTRNLTSVRASRSMSGWDGPVASRSLAVRPRCLGCARGCRYPPLPSSTLDNAAAVIAADARAGLFGPCQACSAFSLPGRISGGRLTAELRRLSCV